MSIGKMLTNPWVLAGGAAVGLIILMSGKGGTSSGPNIGATLSSLEISNDMNKAGLAFRAAEAETAASVSMASMAKDASIFSSTAAMLGNLMNAATVRAATMAEANAGVMNSIISQRGAISLERQAGANRIALATLESDTTLKSLMIEAGMNPFKSKAYDGKGKHREKAMFGLSKLSTGTMS